MNLRWLPPYQVALRVSFSLILAGFTIHYIQDSIHWQVMWDTSIMHYVNFLMAHGLAPYREILDNNLPGAYLFEGWAIQVFGTGDLGWRLYDYTLLAVLILSLIVISLPYDWFAGFVAGVFFVMLHGSEGPPNAAQREQVMTTLMVAGYALLFTGLRRARPWMFLPFGFTMGLAASLKPTAAPLAMVLMGMAAYSLWRRSIAIATYMGYAAAGFVAAISISVAFLVRYHAVSDFLEVSRRLTGYYTQIGNASLRRLISNLLTPADCLCYQLGLLSPS